MKEPGGTYKASTQPGGASEAGATGPQPDIHIGFEAVKVGLKQDGRGHVLTLLLHPNDVHPDLLASPIKTRYAVRMVELNDQDEELEPKLAKEGEALIAKAGKLCRNERFQTWCYTTDNATGGISEADAADYVRRVCGVKTRAEFRSNFQARALFKNLVAAFEDDVKHGRA